MSMKEFLIRDTDGKVDLDATTNKFRDALLVYLVDQETEQLAIAGAVSAVFDTHKGANINLPAVATFALRHLPNVEIGNVEALTEKVKAYVRENAISETNPAGMFLVAKGRNGGVRRVSDLSKPAS